MFGVQKDTHKAFYRFKYNQWIPFPHKCSLLDPYYPLCSNQKNCHFAHLIWVKSDTDSYCKIFESLKKEHHTGSIGCIILVNAELKVEFPKNFFSEGQDFSIPCLLISHHNGKKLSQAFLSQKPQASNQSVISKAGEFVGGIINYLSGKEKRAQYVRELAWEVIDAKQMFDLLNEQIFLKWNSIVSVFNIVEDSNKTTKIMIELSLEDPTKTLHF